MGMVSYLLVLRLYWGLEHYNTVGCPRLGQEGQEPQVPSDGAMNPGNELAREGGEKESSSWTAQV